MEKMKYLKPVKSPRAVIDEIEKRIKAAFRDHIYIPIREALEIPGRIENAPSKDGALLEAIRAGRVTFHRGVFSGKFSAAVSRELRKIAKWDKATSTFRVTAASLPPDIRMAIEASEALFSAKLAGLDSILGKILPAEIAGRVHVADLFDKALWKTQKDLDKTLEGIAVPPDLNARTRRKISDEWQENMDLWIKDFTEKEISSLRAKIRVNTFAGNRYEAVAGSIHKSYGVSAAKARFLARQETNLLLTKFKESRYTQAGIQEYKWVCVHMPKDKTPNHHTPGNVRYTHGLLDGTIHRWDTPPITSKPGERVRRNNPNSDYNCRCAAHPQVSFKKR